PSSWGRGRPRQNELFKSTHLFLHLALEVLGRELHLLLIAAFEGQQRDAAERRILQLPPEFDFLLIKAFEVMAAGALDRRVKGREGLYEDLAFHIAPAGASGHLRQQLKGPLAGPEVGLMQR